MSRFTYGYRIDLEDFAELKRTSKQLPRLSRRDRDNFPDEIDPRGWHRIEDQGQQGSCFPAGTKITMADGSLRDVESIRFGESVLSHRGVAQPVIDTMRRNFTGEMITVFAKGWGKLTMTDDHVVLVKRGDREQWVRADGLREDDHMIVSRGIPAYSSRFVDLANYLDLPDLYADDDWVCTPGSNRTKRFVPLDDLACYVIGLYVAEGSSSYSCAGKPHRACWTLHEDEMSEAEKIERWAKSLGLPTTIDIKKESKAINVRVCSTVLAEFLKNVCGRFCNHKQVPEFICRGTDEQKLAFLKGYFDGDGTLGKIDQGRVSSSGNLVSCNQISSGTASKVLAQQISTIFISLGMKPGRSITKKRDHQQHTSHQVYLYSVDAGKFRSREVVAGKARKVVESESGQCRRIREITRQSVVDFPVFDFTVAEDHSFVANGMAVHNCQGHAQSSVCEMAYWIATKGDVLQFSPKFAYIMSQRIDGITGDQGSTINAGRLSAMQNGSCPLDVCPYSERYDTNISRDAIEAAEPFKIRSHTLCRNYDDIFTFLASGQGGVEIGIAWPDAWMQCHGPLENFRPGGGGHAVSFLGYSQREDRRGRKYLWLANSWSEEWDDGGWAEVSPDCANQMAQHQDSVFIGLSDLSVDEDEVRDFDWTGGLR